jgi:hypothetical protein
MKKISKALFTATAILALGASESRAAGSICLNGTTSLGITPPANYAICQGKDKPIRFTIKAPPNYNGLTSLSTTSCALNIVNNPNVQLINGVAEVVTTARGPVNLAPGTYNCTVSVATPSPSQVATGGGCIERYAGSTITFSYTLKRANLCP